MSMQSQIESQREERLRLEREKVSTNEEIIKQMKALQTKVADLQKSVDALKEELPKETRKVVRAEKPSGKAQIIVTLLGFLGVVLYLQWIIATKTGNVYMLVQSLAKALNVQL